MAVVIGNSIGKSKRIVLTQSQSIPALVRLEGFNTNATVLLNAVGFGQMAGVQYMQTLKRSIYVYVFGERMGTVTVSGVVLWNPCEGSPGAGLQNVLNYYRSYTVSQRSTPISVTIGATQAIRGYLDGVQTTFQSAESGQIGFQFKISTLPVMWGSQ